MSVVLDASAVLAYLHGEPGHELVAAALDDGVISAVNWAEALQKIDAAGGDVDRLGNGLLALGLDVAALTRYDARVIARLWQETCSAGLSLGDRACLATAQRLELPTLTADRAWSELDLEVDVQLIR